MGPRRFVDAVLARLRRRLRARPSLHTIQFLRSTPVWLKVWHPDDGNYSALLVQSSVSFRVKGELLQLMPHLVAEQRLQVRLIREATGDPVVEVIVPVDDLPKVVRLPYDSTILELEIGDVQEQA